MSSSERQHRVAASERTGLRIEDTSDLWWKNAIVYCLDIETFLDSNGDGIGDFDGLMQGIDYLAGLGVTCIWLMPFYPTPNRDDGYDILDYYDVDPRLGRLGQLVELVRTARDRGIRVIADLVINHTSVQHPWFQDARSSVDSPYREYYVWSDERTDEFESVMFPDVENSNWEWDEQAGQYYLHRFYAHQPDLNPASPAVREEIEEIGAFWLQQGLAGFRLDAVPYLIELEGVDQDVDLVPHGMLRELRSFLMRRRGDLLLLGEVNRSPEVSSRYFGEGGDELDMLFNFTANQKLFLSLARQKAAPLAELLRDLPEIPEHCQWGYFVSNHDELTLDQLPDDERQEVFDAFAQGEEMRLYGRGIRRRLPTMLRNDRRRMEMVYSLLFALPGTPFLYYGEEIGMAENLEVEGRRAVRTPMQWSGEPNGGFSTADRDQLRRPPPRGDYSPERVNVADQRRDPDSFLSWVERVIRRRRECPEIGMGQWKILDCDCDAVLAHQATWCGSTVVVAHNFCDRPVEFRLDLELPDDFVGLVELLSDSEYDPPPEGSAVLRLDRFGYRWFRIRRKGVRMPL